ncbi:MAG: thiamine pyrophosphate-dependent enzyme [Candidatus Odinarchaeota archaeon]
MSIVKPKDLALTEERLAPGHRLCPGCAEPTTVKLVLKASEEPVIVCSATGCLEVSTSIYPYTSWNVPWIHSAFENAAATASGVEAAIKALKRNGVYKYDKVNVLAVAGDGGTFDIGFQALSGAFERYHRIVYLLLDNEAYMNTGIQRSGGTPSYASTTTSPDGKIIPGKLQTKKQIGRIMVEHEPSYVATIAAAFWQDLIQKAKKAFAADGPAFLHSIAPCPRGWRHTDNLAIELCKLAVQTCIFPLWEAEKIEGKMVYRLSPPSKQIAKNPDKKKPVVEYLKLQGRYRHLFKPEEKTDLLKTIQDWVDTEWNIILERCGEK